MKDLTAGERRGRKHCVPEAEGSRASSPIPMLLGKQTVVRETGQTHL